MKIKIVVGPLLALSLLALTSFSKPIETTTLLQLPWYRQNWTTTGATTQTPRLLRDLPDPVHLPHLPTDRVIKRLLRDQDLKVHKLRISNTWLILLININLIIVIGCGILICTPCLKEVYQKSLSILRRLPRDLNPTTPTSGLESSSALRARGTASAPLSTWPRRSLLNTQSDLHCPPLPSLQLSALHNPLSDLRRLSTHLEVPTPHFPSLGDTSMKTSPIHTPSSSTRRDQGDI